jgi:hypothetical protein
MRNAREIPFFWDGERYVKFSGVDAGPPYRYDLRFGSDSVEKLVSQVIPGGIKGSLESTDDLKRLVTMINTMLAPRLRGFHVDAILLAHDLAHKGTRVWFG